MGKYYILDGHNSVETSNVLEWGKWFETADRTVELTHIDTNEDVSTVFLGLDHQWSDGLPLLFETMVFGGKYCGDMDRYSTWDEAVKGHRAMVKRVLSV